MDSVIYNEWGDAAPEHITRILAYESVQMKLIESYHTTSHTNTSIE